MLLDRLVCGINDEDIQKKLLAEIALTYERALTISQRVGDSNEKICRK